jgi:hypothetical protein
MNKYFMAKIKMHEIFMAKIKMVEIMAILEMVKLTTSI